MSNINITNLEKQVQRNNYKNLNVIIEEEKTPQAKVRTDQSLRGVSRFQKVQPSANHISPLYGENSIDFSSSYTVDNIKSTKIEHKDSFSDETKENDNKSRANSYDVLSNKKLEIVESKDLTEFNNESQANELELFSKSSMDQSISCIKKSIRTHHHEHTIISPKNLRSDEKDKKVIKQLMLIDGMFL